MRNGGILSIGRDEDKEREEGWRYGEGGVVDEIREKGDQEGEKEEKKRRKMVRGEEEK